MEWGGLGSGAKPEEQLRIKLSVSTCCTSPCKVPEGLGGGEARVGAPAEQLMFRFHHGNIPNAD